MIEINTLFKKYGDKVAVNNISAVFSERGVHAILGPVGAGKTTMLDILSGYITADSGEVTLGGVDITEASAEIKKRIAYLPKDLPLYEDMTAYEHLVFIGQAKRVPEEKLYKRVKSIMDITRISEVAERTIRKLTVAEKRALGVAQCMLGNPDVIMFDEPMESLDAEERAQLGALIKKLGEHKCVIMSASVLSDIEDICDDLMIISRGEIIVKDSIKAIEEKLIATRAISVSIRGDEEVIVSAIKTVDGISSCIVTSNEGGVLSMKIEYDKGAEIRGALFAALAKISCPILSMVEKSFTLSDIYLQLVDADREVPTEPKAETSKKKFGIGGRRK